MLGKEEHGSSVLNYSYVLVSNFFLNTLKLNVPGEIYIYILKFQIFLLIWT